VWVCVLVGQAGRRCGLFGCLKAATWILSDPQGAELPACEVELLDVFIEAGLPARASPRVQPR